MLWQWYGSGRIDRRSRRSVDYGSIRVGIRLLFISTFAILLPTPVGPGLLTFGVGGRDRPSKKVQESRAQEQTNQKPHSTS